MARAYPLLLGAGNVTNLWVAHDGADIVAHVGYRLVEIDTGKGVYLGALFGAVFTAEAWRGQGLATQVLSRATEAARQQGAAFGVISGTRNLYQRQGFFPLPRATGYRIDGGSANGPHALTMRPITTSQWGLVQALHASRTPRFSRGEGDWKALLESQTLWFGAGEVWAVFDESSASSPGAYFALEKEPRTREATGPCRRALEWGGNALWARQALEQCARTRGLVEWVVAAHDAEAHRAAAQAPRLAGRLVDLGISAAAWRLAVATDDIPLYGLDYV